MSDLDFDARVRSLADAGDVLAREVLRLRELVLSLSERLAAQSELLSKRAERPEHTNPPETP